MSWLDGETDVLEKLHGALTEVGLPACETAGERERKKISHGISLHINLMGGAASPPDGETEGPPPRHNPKLTTRRKTNEAYKA